MESRKFVFLNSLTNEGHEVPGAAAAVRRRTQGAARVLVNMLASPGRRSTAKSKTCASSIMVFYHPAGGCAGPGAAAAWPAGLQRTRARQKLLAFQACAPDIDPGGGAAKTQDEPAMMATRHETRRDLDRAASSEAADMRAATWANPPRTPMSEEGLRRDPFPFTIVNLSRSSPIERLNISPRVDGISFTVLPGRYLIYRPPLGQSASCRRSPGRHSRRRQPRRHVILSSTT
jgi:hypothetical protein